MASLSVSRRRQAWVDGVVSGATGHGQCLFQVPKLIELYERGAAFGRANADTPDVKALVAAQQRSQQPKAAPRPPVDRFRSRSSYGGSRPSSGGPRPSSGGLHSPQTPRPP